MLMHLHFTIEEIGLLTESEKDVILYICNVLFPYDLPTADETNPYPISLNLIRYAKRESVIEKIKQAESHIKDEYKEIYNGLKTKLGVF